MKIVECHIFQVCRFYLYLFPHFIWWLFIYTLLCLRYLYYFYSTLLFFVLRLEHFPYLICVCESQTQIAKKRLSRSRLPPRFKKPIANICDSQYT